MNTLIGFATVCCATTALDLLVFNSGVFVKFSAFRRGNIRAASPSEKAADLVDGRTLALLWVVGPRFITDCPSLSQLARRLGVSKDVVINSVAQLTREHGVRNRAQMHGWNLFVGVMGNNACVKFFLGPRPRREIPDFALCKHTRRGRQMKRGFDHFFAAGAVITNENPACPDPYKDEVRALLTTGLAQDAPQQEELL